MHGIIWLNHSVIEKYLNPNRTINVDHEDLGNLIDEWSSCSLQTGNSDLDSIVKEVNVHKHKPTCRPEKDKECRFDFPKLPSDKTLVAHPLPKDVSDEERKSILKKVKLVHACT